MLTKNRRREQQKEKAYEKISQAVMNRESELYFYIKNNYGVVDNYLEFKCSSVCSYGVSK